MQQHRFDPDHPDYEGGEPTAMPPISDPNHPDHKQWSEEQVYGGTPSVVTEAPPVEPTPPKRTRARAAKKATKKATAAKKATAKK